MIIDIMFQIVNDKPDESERGKLLVALSYNVQQVCTPTIH